MSLDLPHPVLEKDIRFHWMTPEYVEYERTPAWYFFAALFVLFMVFFGIVTQSWSMAMAFLLLAGVYYLIHEGGHRQIDFFIATSGIILDGKFFPFSALKSFYVYYDPKGRPSLVFIQQGRYQQPLRIFSDGQDIAVVTGFLSRELPELAGVKESLLERIIRICKL